MSLGTTNSIWLCSLCAVYFKEGLVCSCWYWNKTRTLMYFLSWIVVGLLKTLFPVKTSESDAFVCSCRGYSCNVSDLLLQWVYPKNCYQWLNIIVLYERGVPPRSWLCSLFAELLEIQSKSSCCRFWVIYLGHLFIDCSKWKQNLFCAVINCDQLFTASLNCVAII